MRLTGQICNVVDLSQQDRRQMYELMQRYYANVRQADFDRDLKEKQSVIVAREPGNNSVAGFSTQTVTSSIFDGESVRVLFSGDTIVDHRYWGRNPLAQLWGRLVLSLIDQFPDEPLYWFLISKGYKTYRFLPVFFRAFYPRYDQPTPDWAQRLTASVATERFGDRFEANRGIVVADPDGCRLRADVAEVTGRRLRDPHIAFFSRRNPQHTKGDELCCIAALTRENFESSAYRVIGLPTETAS